jgi:hypothetical protein
MSKGKALAGSLIPILMVGLLVFYGCSKDNAIVEPVSSDPYDELNIVRVADDAHSVSGGSYSAEEYIIAADGGTVELQFSFYGVLDADHIVDVPAAALPADTIISITAPIPWMAVVDLGTDGLVFKRPVDVDLNFVGPFLGSQSLNADYGVFRWDPDAVRWEEIPSTVTYGDAWINAQFSVDHFSRYAVAER